MHSNENIKKIEALQMLANYLNKPLKPEQADHYMKRMQGMPHGFVIRFCQDCMNESPPGMPSRFPSINDIEKRYREVGSPGRASMGADYKRTDCPDCFGEGLIWWMVETPTMFVELCGKCGRCSNHQQHGPLPVPSVRRQDLIGQGYKVFPYGR